MLRAVQNVSWRQHLTNNELYDGCMKITDKIRERRLKKMQDTLGELKMKLLVKFYCGSLHMEKRNQGRPARTFVDQLEEDIGCSKENLPILMADRMAWRKHVMNIRTCSTW